MSPPRSSPIPSCSILRDSSNCVRAMLGVLKACRRPSPMRSWPSSPQFLSEQFVPQARRIAPRSRRSRRRFPWETLTDDQLLSLRFCDLKLTIEGTDLEEAIDRLYRELATRGIRFRPHC